MIYCVGMDKDGNILCVIMISGFVFKILGWVGDLFIIGVGLYCDNEVGFCGSMGRGEVNL